MALPETIEYDKIENNLKLRQFTYRKIQLSKVVEKLILGNRFIKDRIDASDNLIDNPLDKEPDGTTDIIDKLNQYKINKVTTSS